MSISLYVDHTGEPLVDHTGEPLPAGKRYARVPLEVLGDERLSPRDVRVFAALAVSCWQGNFSSVGKRSLAQICSVSERLVLESLKRLGACGHITKTESRRGYRAGYLLLSPVFGQKQRSGEVAELVSSPRKRLATVRVA